MRLRWEQDLLWIAWRCVTVEEEQETQALLILDMVNPFDFPDGTALCRQALAIAPAIRRLRSRVRQRRGSVVFVNDNFAHWKADFRELVAMASSTRGGAILEQLTPEVADHFILKPKHSGFFCTPLELLLDQLGARQLIVTGVAADACVLATALDARMRDFDVHVPVDCVAAATAARKRAALSVLAHARVDTRASPARRG